MYRNAQINIKKTILVGRKPATTLEKIEHALIHRGCVVPHVLVGDNAGLMTGGSHFHLLQSPPIKNKVY